jgi:rhodanese-related sulfurtransferase
LEEESSARAALLLIENGFTHVNPILGGFNAWVEAGYPVESGN